MDERSAIMRLFELAQMEEDLASDWILSSGDVMEEDQSVFLGIVVAPGRRFCDVCQKQVSSNNWTRHLETKKHQRVASLTMKLRKCPHCGYVGLTAQALCNHKQRNHGGISKKVRHFRCTACDINLRDRDHIRRHVVSRKHISRNIPRNPDPIQDVFSEETSDPTHFS